MKTNDFNFDLPESLIAQHPLEDRSSSRLMVLNKESGETTERVFREITDYFNPGDCIVLNNTRVLPARLFGQKDTGATVEFLLLKRIEGDVWETLVKPGKKAKVGVSFTFGDGQLKGEIVGHGEAGSRHIKFEYEGIFEQVLDELGNMPLPPYITAQLEDKERYQTVFSKHPGSAAAPTAGLHFTNELLDELTQKGVKIAYVTLHVGLGTFRPVKAEDILEHEMHAEYYEIDQEAVDIIKETKANGGKVISVGTTSTRVLESSIKDGELVVGSGWTDIFIYPGYSFNVIDGLITNFHLPESTLIMLVSALSTREYVLAAYNEAVEKEFRFFSFGDAMLIV